MTVLNSAIKMKGNFLVTGVGGVWVYGMCIEVLVGLRGGLCVIILSRSTV